MNEKQHNTHLINNQGDESSTPSNAQFPVSIPVPSSGPLEKFIDAAANAGIPRLFAIIAWIFYVVSTLGTRATLTVGGVSSRLTAGVFLAGQEFGLPRQLVNIVRNAIAADISDSGIFEFDESPLVATEIETPLKAAHYEILSMAPAIWRFSHCCDDLLARWSSAARQPFSIADVADPLSINGIAISIGRALDMPPTGVSMLTAGSLKAAMDLNRADQGVFESLLVVPCFGEALIAPRAQLDGVDLTKLLRQESLMKGDDLEITFSKGAVDALQEGLANKMQYARRSQVPGELDGSRRRLSGLMRQTLMLAVGYAVDIDLSAGRSVTGKVDKKAVELALEAIWQIFNAWTTLDAYSHRARFVAPALAVYQIICTRFDNYKTPCGKYIRLKFAQLVEAFCHHARTRGKYLPREFEIKILGELVRRELAEKAERVGKTQYWHFVLDSGGSMLATAVGGSSSGPSRKASTPIKALAGAAPSDKPAEETAQGANADKSN